MSRFKLLITTMIVSAVFASCTKYNSNAIPLPGSAAQCNSGMTGDNVYKGYLSDYALEGVMGLMVTEVGGQMGSSVNVNITGFLSVNGQDFCCRTMGTAVVEKQYQERLEGDYGAISTVSLMCSPINGGYQQFPIKLGVDCPASSGQNGYILHKMYLKEDKTMVGCFNIDNPMMQSRTIMVTE